MEWETEALSLKDTLGDWEQFSIPGNGGELDTVFFNSTTSLAQRESPEHNDADDSMVGPFDPGPLSAVSSGGSARCGSFSQQKKRRYSTRKLTSSLSSSGARPRCMADPHSPYRMAWDLLVICPCLLYLTIVLPYRLCFDHRASGGVWILETVMDILFVIDIFVNFRTGFFSAKSGLVVYDQKKVAWRYIKSWFFVDVLSGFPFGLLSFQLIADLSAAKVLKGGRVLKAAKVMRFFKLTRLLKTTKIFTGMDRAAFDRVQDYLSDVSTRSAVQMFKVLFIISFSCHFLACIWVAVGRRGYKSGANNWLENDTYVQSSGWEAGDTTGTSTTAAVYVAAYYFCFTTITSVGYGDIGPRSTTERIFCICLEAIGGCLYALVIAEITSIVTQKDANLKMTSERLDAISSYINNRGIPDHIGSRVRRFFRHFYKTKTAIDEHAILMDLPSSLRNEVSSFLVSGLMSNVTAFRNVSPVLWARIVPLLRPCRFENSEIVCQQGEACVESFVVLEGQLVGSTDANLDRMDIQQSRDIKTPTVVSERSTPPSISFGKSGSSILDAMRQQKSSLGPQQELPQLNASLKVAQSGDVHERYLEPGSCINVLCLLDIWMRCVETITPITSVECYAISHDSFNEVFLHHQESFYEMQEQCALTSFHMIKPKVNASTRDFGIPLYMYSEEEIAHREIKYLEWKEKKMKAQDIAQRKYEASRRTVVEFKKTIAVNKAAQKFLRSRRSTAGPTETSTLTTGAAVAVEMTSTPTDAKSHHMEEHKMDLSDHESFKSEAFEASI